MIIFLSARKCFILPSAARETSPTQTDRQCLWQYQEDIYQERDEDEDILYLPGNSIPSLQQILLPPVGLVPHPDHDEGCRAGRVLDVFYSDNFKGGLKRHSSGPTSEYAKFVEVRDAIPELLTISWCMSWLACFCWLWWCGESKPIFIIQYWSFPAACESFICFLPTCTAPRLCPHIKVIWLTSTLTFLNHPGRFRGLQINNILVSSIPLLLSLLPRWQCFEQKIENANLSMLNTVKKF